MPAGSAGRVGSRVLKGGPSKLRGVIWHKSNGKWEARIYETGKQRFLGYFTSEVSAAKAYDARAVQLHGSAAKVNFPEDHYETRNNPPAVKPFCALSIPTPAKEDDLPHGKCRSSWTSLNAAGKRTNKRKDESKDEDYVLPSQSRSRRASPQYSLRRHSSRKLTHEHTPADVGDSDSEESLEKGAVQVLATLLSSSEQDGSWRSSNGSAVRWSAFGDAPKVLRASSPPTASTGASPAPPPKQGAWAPPLFVQNGEAGSNESYSQPMETLQACARMRLDTLGSTEDFAESHFPFDMRAEDDGSSSESEQVSANLHVGTSTPALEASQTRTDQNAKVDRSLVSYANTGQALQDRSPAMASAALEAPPAFADLPRSSVLNLTRALSSAASTLTPRSQEQDLSKRGREAGMQVGIGSKSGSISGPGVKSTRGSSRFRGVSWCEKGQKWRALLWDGNRQHFLGHFKSEEEGARAYDRALLTRKKKDGCLNFPITDYSDITEQQELQLADSKPKQAVKLHHAGGTPAQEKNTGRLFDKSNDRNHDCQTESKGAGLGHHFKAPRMACQELSHSNSAVTKERTVSTGVPKESVQSFCQDGLMWCQNSNKWRAAIRWGSTTYQLGAFNDKHAAAQAYNEAVVLRCGQNSAQMLPRHVSGGSNPAAVAYCNSYPRNTESWEPSSQPLRLRMHCPVYQSELDGATRPAYPRSASAKQSISPNMHYSSASWRSAAGHASYFNNDCPAVTSTGWGQKKRRCLSPGSD